MKMGKALLRVFTMIAMIIIITSNQILCLAENDPFSDMLVYQPGQYKVGKDMEPGEYVLLSTTSTKAYFAVSSDPNGRNIIVNDNFDTNSIITCEIGDYLELSRCIAIKATDFYSKYTIKTSNYGTMLKVGYDILPGEYKIIAKEGAMGYYCIYNSSRQDYIVDNNNFKNSNYVELKSGQYIVLSRCKIVD